MPSPIAKQISNPSASERQKFQILGLVRPTLSMLGRHGPKQNCYSLQGDIIFKFESSVNTK